MSAQQSLVFTGRSIELGRGRTAWCECTTPDFFQNAAISLDNTQWGYSTKELQRIPLFAGEL
jgi:hypothetical protein